ncbi:hypothetical protein CM19_00160 [Candidatus Acidianus copahuensis]|uniref:Uncharacterized protein n=1 Tax=Candidatus Acidianus copahuensis TaxID=1160895 RepID=A0A031LW68_9CREN|nr:hypothetical protein [Candidatus Acidianus copahuensis]EZQ12025.1 hypothetical protein CM19_00160 [Candidatus Acidianus copahuensis]
MELEKSMIKRLSISSVALFYLLLDLMLISVFTYLGFYSVKNIYAPSEMIWYGIGILYMLDAVAAGFSLTLIYQSSSLAYYIRFSKFKTYIYILSLFIAALISGMIYTLIYGGIIFPIIVFLHTGNSFEIITLSNLLPLLVSITISSLFMFLLVFLFTNILLLKFGAKASRYSQVISYFLFILIIIPGFIPGINPIYYPIYGAEYVISYSLVNATLSPYILELIVLSALLAIGGNLIFKRMKMLRLEEVVW